MLPAPAWSGDGLGPGHPAAVSLTRHLLDDDVEGALSNVTHTLVHTLDADRAYVFENRYDDGQLVSTRQCVEAVREPALSERANAELQEAPYAGGFERWGTLLSEGAPVRGAVRDFPVPERRLLVPQRIASLAAVPVTVGERFWGFVGVDAVRHERVWTDDEVALLRVAAHCVAALALRRRAEREAAALRGELAFATDAFDAALEAIGSSPRAEARAVQDPLLVRTATKVVPLAVDDILWVEAADNYSVLHAATGSYLTRQYLGTLEERLRPRGIVRIHRSTLVALRAVEHLTPGGSGTFEVRLVDGTALRASRTYAAALRDRIL